MVTVKSLPRLHTPSQGKHNSHTEQENVGFSKVFIQLELFDKKPVIQWIYFHRCLLMDILAADDDSSVWDEETERL